MRVVLSVTVLSVFLLGGCAVTPDTITHQSPKKNLYEQQPVPVVVNGSIYQANAYRPIFEDHKARLVGDNLTIQIMERNTATKSGNESNERTNAASVGAPMFFNRNFPRLSASADGNREYEESGAKSANNVFSGTIAVTVIDVLPNGNLIVSGEKQIAMDSGAEFIRFSGIVDPKDISIGNTVLSTKVADARVEYRTNTRLDAADVIGKLARFFLSVLPF